MADGWEFVLGRVIFFVKPKKYVDSSFFLTRYVDYAMHRVRLLRHFGIKPYIVFDGGLLPAKKGTEHERKQKREENLASGNAFAVQGKHYQARDCYLKGIDVSPQMAFQFIKVRPCQLVLPTFMMFIGTTCGIGGLRSGPLRSRCPTCLS